MKIDQKKVTFVSLTTNTLNGDFKRIDDELKKHTDLKVCYMLMKFKKNLLGDFLYFLNCLKQLFVINTSHVVIIHDNNYVISNFKRDGVKVIQIWHACGALKKFGNEIHRQYEIKNYDYVLSTSDRWKTVYSNSFGVKEENILPLGLPRTDNLFSKEKVMMMKNSILTKYPILKDKYVVLYAPTFRGNIIKGMTYIDLRLDHLLKQLPEDYVILYKMHPLLGDVSLGEDKHLIQVNHDNLNELFSVSDCLITDYSSIVYDFSILEKKIIYYIPDLTQYTEEIGINDDFNQMPGDVCLNEKELVNALIHKEYNVQAIQTFKDRHFTYQDGKNAERIADFIYQLIEIV